MAYRIDEGTVRWGMAAPPRSPATAAAAPAATQRSCWRSTPTEDRNRSTTHSSDATMVAIHSRAPAAASAAATLPAGPASPNGLAIEVSSSRAGARLEPRTTRTAATTAATATTRQRRERNRPSGTTSAGRVTPRTVAGAQLNSPDTAASWAGSGSGRCSATSWATHVSPGMARDHTSPAAAYSQPIGFAGRCRLTTRPTVAKPSGKVSAPTAPSARTARVSGLVRARVTSRPPAQQPKVASHNPQATIVVVRGCSFTVLSSRPGLAG
jgi:hypothetical protein